MNLEEEILKEHSKANALSIAAYVGNDPNRFDQLMQLFLYSNYRVTQRAAWPVSICAKQNTSLISPYLTKVINNLRLPVHDAVIRNSLSILQNLDVPEELMGELADVCFHYLCKASTPVAIKVFSMTILLNVAKKEPDLKCEIQQIIEDQMPYGSPGFISRGTKILKQLQKI